MRWLTSPDMDSTTAKVALLQYCRFSRQYHYVATEVSIAEGLADVLASDGKNLIEYEIKVSMSDLLKDRDKPKHVVYNPEPIVWDGMVGTKGKLRIELVQGQRTWEPDKWSAILVEGDKKHNITGWHIKESMEQAKADAENAYGGNRVAPNTLYYVIPTLLWEKNSEKILASLHPSYGVITFEDSNHHKMLVVKKAKKLHKNLVSQGMLTTIVARMGSELATLTNMFYSQVKEFTEYGKRVEERFEMGDDEEEVD